MDSNACIGKPRTSLPTPCLVVREQKLAAALKKMKETKNGKNLRPHIKSHKSVRLGKRQVEEGGAIGLAAAKVSEAEPFVSAGITDVLLTSPTSHPDKIQDLVNLWAKSGGQLSTVVDSEEGIQMLAQAVRTKQKTLGNNNKMTILLDIDGGQERTGVATISEAKTLSELLVGPCADVFQFVGAQTYLGHIQHIPGFAERKKASEEGLARGYAILKELRDEKKFGELPVHTGVGTGTHEIDVKNEVVTEIQPGSYCLMDAEYCLIEWEDDFWGKSIPMTLLTSVVSNKHFPRHLTVDGGWKATYLFPSAPNIVVKPKGFPEGVTMEFSYQGDEHGRISFSGEVEKLDVGLFPLGGTVEVVVSHVDPTVNLHDYLFFVDEETDKCVDVYDIEARGCVF